MNIIATKLWKKNFRPDVIITFNRSGTTLAGMFAVNMKIDEIISITRHQKKSAMNTSTLREAYVVGEHLKLNPITLKDKRILVLMMLIETGTTHEDGIRFLRNQKITQEIEIASMYVTQGALNRWPHIIYAFETADPKGVLRNLPWVEEYDFFPRKIIE
jgi:hypoxanthine phosphoribosyltransferase